MTTIATQLATKLVNETTKELLQEFQERGIALPAEFVQRMTDGINILDERAKSAKRQIVILNQTIDQLGKNQGVATLEASFRKTRDTVRSIRDRLNDLTIQRARLEFQSLPTLFDDSAIAAEQINLEKEKEELENYLEPYKDLPEYAEYVANIRDEWEKLAKLRLERIQIDSSPNRGSAESFFSDIKEGQGIGQAFSNLGVGILGNLVTGITKPAIDALTSVIDSFTKPITDAFGQVFSSIVKPVGDLFSNTLGIIFKPISGFFSKIFGGLGSLFGGGGLGGGLGSLFGGGGLGGGLAAPITSSIPFLESGATFGLGSLSFFATGGTVGETLQNERAISGKQPELVVAHRGEEILTTLNKDAQFWRALKRSGQWDELKTNGGMPAYAYGGTVGGSSGSTVTMSRTRSPIVNNTTFVINANDPNSFRSTESQIKERMERRNREVNERYR